MKPGTNWFKENTSQVDKRRGSSNSGDETGKLSHRNCKRHRGKYEWVREVKWIVMISLMRCIYNGNLFRHRHYNHLSGCVIVSADRLVVVSMRIWLNDERFLSRCKRKRRVDKNKGSETPHIDTILQHLAESWESETISIWISNPNLLFYRDGRDGLL